MYPYFTLDVLSVARHVGEKQPVEAETPTSSDEDLSEPGIVSGTMQVIAEPLPPAGLNGFHMPEAQRRIGLGGARVCGWVSLQVNRSLASPF